MHVALLYTELTTYIYLTSSGILEEFNIAQFESLKITKDCKRHVNFYDFIFKLN